MKMALCAATMQPSSKIPSHPDWGVLTRLDKPSQLPGDLGTWAEKASNPAEMLQDTWLKYNTPEHNAGVIGSYDHLYRWAKADVLAYLHDDVTCREDGWDLRVLKEFEDETVGVAGFGGGLQHGSNDIYKTPYRLQQLARSYYFSNVDDAEVHGRRSSGVFDVAVVDGFALVVRRSLLELIGGWPVDRYPPHHNYDYWICCMAHRHAYRVRFVGVRCHHHGGRTAVSKEYHQWAKTTRWGSDAGMHEAGHRLIYDDFRDVLPWGCNGAE